MFLTLMVPSNLALVTYGAYLRFSHTGRVCSGDFSDEKLLPNWGVDIDEQAPYLLNMGHFLQTFSIGIAILYIYALFVFLSAAIFKRRKSQAKVGNVKSQVSNEDEKETTSKKKYDELLEER